MPKQKISIGTWITIPNEQITEIIAKSPYDWIVIDLEHSTMSLDQAENLIRIIDANKKKSYVRITSDSTDQIKRMLDAGASGIIAPMIETFQQGKAIIDACFYPPRGKRSMGLYRAQGFGEKIAKNKYIKTQSKKIEVFFQIESKIALDNLDEIFSLPINGCFIGPYDLSLSFGDPGNFNSREFKKAEKKIIDYAKKYKIYCGFHQVEPEPKSIDALSKKGFSMIAYSVDFRMLDVMARSPFK